MAWTPSQAGADILTLQMNEERAGRALACAFYSSEEFEEAEILARRGAGAYGLKPYWRYAIAVSTGVGLLAFLLQIR